MARRIVRIFPGFIAASLICLLVVAPLGGAKLPDIISAIPLSFVNMVTLQMPMVEHVFAGTHYAQLDSSMWTIRYEFFCYLIVIPLGLAGLLRQRWSIAVISFGSLLIFGLIVLNQQLDAQHKLFIINKIPHAFNEIIKFMGIFLTGSLFYLYKDEIRYSPMGSLSSQ